MGFVRAGLAGYQDSGKWTSDDRPALKMPCNLARLLGIRVSRDRISGFDGNPSMTHLNDLTRAAAWVMALTLFFALRPAAAQVTYINTFVPGGDVTGGNLQLPTLVSAGPGGQVLVSDTFASVSKAYAADGSYLFSIVPNTATNFGPSHPTYSSIGFDGRYYLSSQSLPTLFDFDATGTGIGQTALTGVSSRAGFALSPTNTIYIATVASATQTAPVSAQISAYSTAGVLLTSFGADRLDRASLRGLALSPDASQVYLIDNNAVLQFTSSGNYLGTFGNTTGDGQLTSPATIAVTQTGLVYVTDTRPGIKVYSASGTYQRTIADTINNAAFIPSAIAVGPTGFIYATGSLAGAPNLVAARFFDPSTWVYGTNAFTNPNTGPTSVIVGAGGLLGQSLTLRAPLRQFPMQLSVGDTLMVANGNLTIAGGAVTAATLAVDAATGPANFSFTAGTLNTGNIVVSSGGVASISQPVTVATSHLRIADAGSKLSVDQNAALSTELLENHGQIYLGAGASLIAYAAAAGEVGNGTFNLNGGTLDLRYAANLGGSGVIQGSGTLATAAFTSSGTVKLSGPSAVRGTFTNQSTGNVEISGQQPTIFFDNVINNGNFTIKSGAAVVFEAGFTSNATPAAALTVAGAARFNTSATVADLKVAGTPTAPTGTIDLADRALIISNSVDGAPTSAMGAAALTNTRNLIIAGWHSGTGITTSAALDDSRLSIGYARAADLFNGQGGTFIGHPVNASDILIRTTLAGDTNLDGRVDFEDLVKVAQNYGQAVSTKTDAWWTDGDFNYDGVTDFADLVRIAQNYGSPLAPATIPSASAAFDADVARAFASVPEPSILGLLALAFCTMAAGHRGRRHSVAH